jgi:hypothetical protein
VVSDKHLVARVNAEAVVMRKIAEYRTHAEKCRELANAMGAPADKDILEGLARSWEGLANLRERDLEAERDS